MFDDLRQFLDKAGQMGDCKVVEGADWNLEIGLITELQVSKPDQPLLIFDKIKGYKPGYRVVTNVIETDKRFALAFGLSTDAKKIGLVDAFRKRINQEFKPVWPLIINNSPLEENIDIGDSVDLLKFPIPKWHQLDGGRYIGTGDAVIIKDPDSGWTNIGTYRVQVHDPKTATIHIVNGHHGAAIRDKYWDRGLACPAAVICGGGPILFSIAYSPACPSGTDDYDYIGWLTGHPLEVIKGKTVDLLLPANAEIALEGEILPPGSETREEGPFGEWQGYYAGGVNQKTIFKVNCVLHRNDPIILGQPPIAASFDTYGNWNIHKAATIWNELDRQMPGVKGVWCYPEGRGCCVTVVSIKQMYNGHAKQVGAFLTGSYALKILNRFAIVVDDDIDPSNIAEVLWSLGTRCDPETTIDIIGGLCGQRSDPILPPDKKNRGELVYSKAVIYACRPYSWIKDFPPTIKSSAEALANTEKKWGKVLFGE